MNEETFWAKSEPAEPQVLPPTSLALEVPKDLSALAQNTPHFVTLANEFAVNSEPSFQVADEMQVRLRAEAKQIEEKRMELTRPLDAVKKRWTDFFRPHVEARTQAAGIYQGKMSLFRRQQREKAEAAQREAERLLREEREKKEAEARRLEAKAAKLKAVAAQEKAMQQADELRAVAAMMPESVALAASEPTTVASNVAELWRYEVDELTDFLGWLQTHREWLSVIKLQDGEMNRLSKQCRNVVKVPGVRFFPKDSFRSKAR